MPGLGLHVDWEKVKDPRNANFLLEDVVEVDERLLPNYVIWLCRYTALNQGETGTCTAYCGYHFLIHPPVVQVKPGHGLTPWDIYRYEVGHDEWADNDDEANLPDNDAGMDYGSSTLALMKTLQHFGLIGTYRWSTDVATISRFVRMQGPNFKGRLGGPVMAGTFWYDSMFRPDAEHILRITPTARIAGGHEWLIKGADQRRGMFRMRNSWGTSWGLNGEAFVPFEVMERLLREDGDSVTTNELKHASIGQKLIDVLGVG